jgi:hypothetical protein
MRDRVGNVVNVSHRDDIRLDVSLLQLDRVLSGLTHVNVTVIPHW